MARIELFEKARSCCRAIFDRFPDPAIRSILNQLDFLIALELGETNERGRLNDIVIGVLTVREIEPLNADLADLLYAVADEVEQMKLRDATMPPVRRRSKRSP